MIRSTASIALVCVLSVTVLSPQVKADTEFRPVDPGQRYQLSQPSSRVVHAMLEQMGLSLPPDERDIGPPTPSPDEGDRQDPDKEKKKDSFFDDEKDFFADDASFDDAVKEMDKAFEETVSSWDEEYERTVAKWDEAREGYLKKKDEYEKTVIPLEAATDLESSSPANGIAPRLANMKPGDYYVLPNALELGIKNQAQRGTCTAFAGVRALESILIQRGIRADFSEEHFYYLSKPKCTSSPCNKSQSGSSTFKGLEESRSRGNAPLLPESSCPYSPHANPTNITNTPLKMCDGRAGVARARSFRTFRGLDQVLGALRNNQPVIAGFKLTNSYGLNKGLVRLYDPVNATAATGPDAGGHANLFVGYIKLPESLSREGDYCIITANSWDEGWGRGGYACLTEAWLRKMSLYFTSVESLVLTDLGMRLYDL